MRLLALQKVWYGGRERLPGDEFECDDNDFIRILSATDMPGGAKVRTIESSQEVILETPPPTPAPALEQQPAPEPAPAQSMTTTDADAIVEAPKRRYYRRREQE